MPVDRLCTKFGPRIGSINGRSHATAKQKKVYAHDGVKLCREGYEHRLKWQVKTYQKPSGSKISTRSVIICFQVKGDMYNKR